MSLIIDALKKAQQLRLKEFKETPFFKHAHPKDKRSLRSLGKTWMFIGGGLVSLLILLFVFWRAISPLLPTQPNRAVVLTEKKPSIPMAERMPKAPTKDILSPEFTEGSKDHPSHPRVAKAPPKSETSVEEKKEEPPIKQQMAEEKKVTKVKPQKKIAVKKSLPPTPPVSLKEEVPSKPIGVEGEGGKDRTLTSEILTHFNLGVHFYDQREILKAIQAYQKVIEVDPTYIEAYNNLGVIYQEMGDFDKALAAYQKSVEINPGYEKGLNNLGILLYLKDRDEEAMATFQKALAANAHNIESYINLGILYKKQGQMDNAFKCYQKALAINPLHGETHYNIALLYEQSENLELAIGHYQKFIQLSSRTHPGLASKVQSHLNNLMAVKKDKRR